MDLVIGGPGYTGVSKSPCNLVLSFRLPQSPERISVSIKIFVFLSTNSASENYEAGDCGENRWSRGLLSCCNSMENIQVNGRALLVKWRIASLGWISSHGPTVLNKAKRFDCCCCYVVTVISHRLATLGFLKMRKTLHDVSR